MRHLEKLKKIFTCCGKECNSSTNGEALNHLLELAEAGELGGTSGNIATCTVTIGSSYYKTDVYQNNFETGNGSLYGGWTLDSVTGSSDFYNCSDLSITTDNENVTADIGSDGSLTIKDETMGVIAGQVVTVTIKWS